VDRPAPQSRRRAGKWVQPAQKSASLLGPNRFRFLNEEHGVGCASDWNHGEWDKLWLYNLHYFDDLTAEGADARTEWHKALVDRWIQENPIGQGNGWEPYPLSLRVVNWIKWVLAGNSLTDQQRQSLAMQVRWLAGRVEWHLLGNHLYTNGKALMVAGLFFSGPEADAWLAKGLAILSRETSEQILADGGHFERSPMYHALALEDVLDLINMARAYPEQIPEERRDFVESLPDVAGSMLSWLRTVCHPDGEISFFNDAALGIACKPFVIDAYAERLGIPSGPAPRQGMTHLASSGYVRVERGPLTAILDVAPIGPDYLPGHAHADTLSFELSLYGERVIVNSGTSCYGDGPERQRQRGTGAHSTVMVDGEDSSEVWGGFRVARRARPVGLEVAQGNGAIRLKCGHDGYRRLPGKPMHWREWRFEENGLVIIDRIQGRFSRAAARFHFHPDVRIEENGSDQGWIRTPGGRVIRWQVTGGRGWLVPSTYHPKFGASLENQCLEVSFAGPETTLLMVGM